MDKDAPSMPVNVVPAWGAEGLYGLMGTMEIIVTAEKHDDRLRYRFRSGDTAG